MPASSLILNLGGDSLNWENLKKQSCILPFYVFSVIVFQLFFLATMIFFYDSIIVVSPFFKTLSREYWNWYLNYRSPYSNETTMITVVYILKAIFSFLFIIGFLYLLSDKKNRTVIGKKNFFLAGGVGMLVYFVFFFWIKYQAVHYRLFMTLFSTELLSLTMAYLLWRLKKEGRLRAQTMDGGQV